MNKVLLYLSMMASTLALVVACGKKDDGGNSNNTTTAVTPTACQSGAVYDSRYGCLPQGSCTAGLAMYQNQCIMVQVNNINGTNCQNYQYGTQLGTDPYQSQCQFNGYNNGVNYNNNYYNGYSFQNGYFYPMNNGYYGNPYYGNPYYRPGFGVRAGVWIRY